MPGPSVAVTELLAPQAFENKNSSWDRDGPWSMRTRTLGYESRIDSRKGKAIMNQAFCMTHSELPMPKCRVIFCAKDVFRASHLLPKLNLFPSYLAGKQESQVTYKNSNKLVVLDNVALCSSLPLSSCSFFLMTNLTFPSSMISMWASGVLQRLERTDLCVNPPVIY